MGITKKNHHIKTSCTSILLSLYDNNTFLNSKLQISQKIVEVELSV